jgi:hypothetical protein
MGVLALYAATVTTEHPEGTCHLVGFADDPVAPAKYLLLQRDLEGIGHSTETPHLEWCDQSMSGYGLVERVALGAKHLEVVLSHAGVELLGGATHISVTFSVPAEAHARLQQSLSKICRGTGSLHVDAA